MKTAYQPKDKLMYQYLSKRGRGKEVQEFNKVDRMIQAALNSGEITWDQVKNPAIMPTHYRNLFNKAAQLRTTLISELSKSHAEAVKKGREEDHMRMLSEESEDIEEAKAKVNNDVVQKSMDTYMDEPTLENRRQLVKDAYLGDISVDEKFQDTEHRSQERLNGTLDHLREKQFKEAVEAKRMQNEKKSNFQSAEEFKQAKIAEALSDKRMVKKILKPGNRELNEFGDRVEQEAAKPVEE